MPLLFAVTMFLSATLLFLIQPLFARMILPQFGGSPAVWNTCQFFYQAALLLGYAYAHAVPAWLGTRRHAALHMGLLLLPFLMLPLAVAPGWTPPGDANPISWVLGLLVVSVGLPFLIVSTSAPLLQKWFAEAPNVHSGDPYYLYAASNLGSFVALLGYPVLVEPTFRLAHQSWLWTAGYAVLVALVGLCAWQLWRTPPAPTGRAVRKTAVEEPLEPPTIWRRLRWLVLSFVPSSLLLGSTTYLTTDIASIPLLWVLPLAAYLLTFILAFSHVAPLLQRLMVLGLPVIVLLVVVIGFFQPHLSARDVIQMHMAALFVGAMVCHGELARLRPPTAYLTEFYLWLAVGGMLGGLFNALVAPLVFDRVVEYPLALAIACLVGPRLTEEEPAPVWARRTSLGYIVFGSLMGLLLVAQVYLRDLRLALHHERNFFGVMTVKLSHESTGTYMVFLHGTTIHGMQSLDEKRRGEPLTYYSRSGPIGQVFDAFSGPAAKKKVALVGLGAGSLACYGEKGQHFTFYELDPAVERIARNPDWFSYLRDCEDRGCPVDVVLGDARLKLNESKDRYGLIILDAFSSDAIPIHLMTREALQVYLDHLDDDGVLAFHISNRDIQLEFVLAALARELRLEGLLGVDNRIDIAGKTPSVWAVLARKREHLGSLAKDERWQPLRRRKGVEAWTDDYSNLLSVFRW